MEQPKFWSKKPLFWWWYFILMGQSRKIIIQQPQLLHAMINNQQLLLSLLPVISDWSPPVFLTPTFAAAVSNSSGKFSHVIDCKVTEAEQNYKPQPQPEIEAQRITRVSVLPLGQPKFLKISNELIMSFY